MMTGLRKEKLRNVFLPLVILALLHGLKGLRFELDYRVLRHRVSTTNDLKCGGSIDFDRATRKSLRGGPNTRRDTFLTRKISIDLVSNDDLQAFEIILYNPIMIDAVNAVVPAQSIGKQASKLCP